MFLFSGDEAEKPVAGLSGGERQRFSLAVLVNSGANMLVLDEPTNHLDLESREALEDALRGFPGSLLLVSHDRALLDAVGNRTVAVEDGALRSYEGGWAEYLEVRAAREEAAKPPPRRRSRRPQAAAAQAKPVDYPKLERQIEEAEAALARIEPELSDPSAWNDPRTSAKSQKRHARAKRRVDELYERSWRRAV